MLITIVVTVVTLFTLWFVLSPIFTKDIFTKEGKDTESHD